MPPKTCTDATLIVIIEKEAGLIDCQLLKATLWGKRSFLAQNELDALQKRAFRRILPGIHQVTFYRDSSNCLPRTNSCQTTEFRPTKPFIKIRLGRYKLERVVCKSVIRVGVIPVNRERRQPLP